MQVTGRIWESVLCSGGGTRKGGHPHPPPPTLPVCVPLGSRYRGYPAGVGAGWQGPIEGRTYGVGRTLPPATEPQARLNFSHD